MSNQITGKIAVIHDTADISEKFSKRDFILEIPGQYTQFIKLTLQQDRCGLIDSYNVGDTVTAFYDLQGKLFTNKAGVQDCFTNIVCWKLSSDSTAAVEKPKAQPKEQTKQEAAPVDDDLPF